MHRLSSHGNRSSHNGQDRFKAQANSQTAPIVTSIVDRPLLLTIKEVSLLVNFSPRKIQRWKCVGWFPKEIIIGGNVRWRCADIEGWVAEGCPKLDNRR